mgnify:CR=1 FL=1
MVCVPEEIEFDETFVEQLIAPVQILRVLLPSSSITIRFTATLSLAVAVIFREPLEGTVLPFNGLVIFTVGGIVSPEGGVDVGVMVDDGVGDDVGVGVGVNDGGAIAPA